MLLPDGRLQSIPTLLWVVSMESIDMIKWAKYSLAFLWISTGIVSTIISPEFGFDLLSRSNIDGLLAKVLVYGGSLVDILLGVWVISARTVRVCCLFQIAVIIVYSIFLTMIDASFWIHPFGPLTKNIPIIVLIGIVYQNKLSKKLVQK